MHYYGPWASFHDVHDGSFYCELRMYEVKSKISKNGESDWTYLPMNILGI